VAVFTFPLLSREYARRKGGHRTRRMDRCRDPWEDMRTTSLWFIYTPISTVAQAPIVAERVIDIEQRSRERVNSPLHP